MRELLSIVLRREGYDVTIAENGRAAIDLLERGAVRPADFGHQDAGHERRRSAPRREAHRSGHARHHDHRLRLGRHRDRSDAAGRARLSEQTVRRRRAENQGPQRHRAAPAPPGERAAEARARHHAPVRQHRRPQRQDARRLQAHRADRADGQHGPHQRRIGDRQGMGGAGDSLLLAEARSPVRRAQLRRAARDAARIGALRPHEGRLHRRQPEQEGADRGGRERHALPRRDWRDEPADAGEVLRVLQERKFRRLGGVEELDTDMRVIAATNQDLPKMVVRLRSSAKTCSTGST